MTETNKPMEVSQRAVPKSIAMLQPTRDLGNLIGGKPGSRIPQFYKKKKNPNKHVRLI